MPVRPSPSAKGVAKAGTTQNKERPKKDSETGRGKKKSHKAPTLLVADQDLPAPSAPHIQTPPDNLNAPAVPLSPHGNPASTSSPASDLQPNELPNTVAGAWHGNGFNVPAGGLEDEATRIEEATTEAILEATAKQGIITVAGIDFHHASEAEFARLLNYYGIDWQYEPHQFPLQWRDGRPVEMFRPDFYLTEYDIYIELTTMRQALVRRKNRKLRLLRALYPEINIKLLYRRDYQRLLERFGIRPEEMEAEAPVALQEIEDEVETETAVKAGSEMRQEGIA